MLGQAWFAGAALVFAGGAVVAWMLLSRPRWHGMGRSRGGRASVPPTALPPGPLRSPHAPRVRNRAPGPVPTPRGPVDPTPDIPAQGGPVDDPGHRPWRTDPP